jgi:hypothetical protein
MTDSCDSGAPGQCGALINNPAVDTIIIATGITKRKEGKLRISKSLTITGAVAREEPIVRIPDVLREGPEERRPVRPSRRGSGLGGRARGGIVR